MKKSIRSATNNLFLISLALSILVTMQGSTIAQATVPLQAANFVYIPAPEIKILAEDYKGVFYVPPPQNMRPNSPTAPTAVTINVTYVGAWTVDARAAFQAAIDIWAGLLTLPSSAITSLDVQANWTVLGANVLGSASSFGYWNLGIGAAYPDVLADALVGYDLGPVHASTYPNNTYEIIANFNSDYSWYTGTDGMPGAQYDLMTVVLHELGHGVGFAGSASYTSGTPDTGSLADPPFVFDCFTADESNISLLDTGTYPNSSASLATAFTGDDIHFGGPNAVAASGTGNNAKLYAPAAWNGGSSYSHLDDATYDGTSHALMTHALATGEAVHNPGSITMGILTDIGWNGGAIPPAAGCPAAPTAITLQTVNARDVVPSFGLLLIMPLLLILAGGLLYFSRRTTDI